MITQLLDQSWTLLRPLDGSVYKTALPASVLSVLSENNVIPEPYWKDNEDVLHTLLEEEFTFSCTFEAHKELLSHPLILLRFEGVDTIADLSVNGQRIGTLRNMHRTWEFPVQNLLREGENTCTLAFHSAFREADAAFKKCATRGTEDAWEGFSHIRKAHYMYGWDWGAHLPDAGIFRDVKLIGIEDARIDSVYVTQTHAADSVTLHLMPEFLAAPDALHLTDLPEKAQALTQAEVSLAALGEDYQAQIAVTAPDGQTVFSGIVSAGDFTAAYADGSPAEDASANSASADNTFADSASAGGTLADGASAGGTLAECAHVSGKPCRLAYHVLIENPQLWWPNGLGNQPLYTVTFTLLRGGQAIDTYTRRIGLRTLTMRTAPDEYGCCFAHEINGQTVFAMGADYIPEEHIIPRKTKQRTRRLLEDCKLANYNSIRVWGGGYYPDDYFYELCDELGLVVWQDFMFACSVYELTEEFEANITQEFIDNIKRIRHHACLGLWCGNNEMEDFVRKGEWVSKPSESRDYLLMYERIIPSVLKRYDPVTFYWPSSPSSGGSFDYPQDPNRGDVHYWEVWHGDKPFTEYRKYFFRYLSEFGFQSFPFVRTVQEGITDDPGDLNPFSYIMEKHQRNQAANGKILNYLQQTYRYPYNFSDVVYASQLLQADGIRYGVEHFRRNRGRCMGAVYWQLNDCWPVISWSSIDYYGRWKALHYYAKRFFAPLLLSCEEQGWVSAGLDFNRQHFIFEKSARFNVSNETPVERQVTVRYALRDNDAKILQSGQETLTVPAFSAVWMEKLMFDDIDLLSQYLSYELVEDGTIISNGTVIFSLPKYFHYKDPELKARVEGDEIVVTAKAYAKSVEILNDTEDLVLSDNYFDMNAGETRVKILRGDIAKLEGGGLKLRSVYDLG